MSVPGSPAVLGGLTATDADPNEEPDPITTTGMSNNEIKSRKRKLDKQTRRAAWKAEKKAKAAAAKLDSTQEEADTPLSVSSSSAAQHGAQKRTGAVTDASLHETAYVLRAGYRMVHPYWFEFSTYAKRRWLGRPIIDVLKGEYGNAGKGTDESQTESYYRAALESGSFRIGGKKVSVNAIVRDGDHFQHYQHRHETPVSAEPVVVHYEDDGIIVIHKPSSIPVHPCGNYRHNSILYILAKEHGLRHIWVIHRLDAVTSGLLILGKTPSVARRLSAHIADKLVRKEYVARVQGRMPEEWQDKVVDVPIYQHNINGQAVMSCTPPKEGESNAAPASAQPHPKSMQAPEARKESVTVFSFLAYDEATNSSLVRCCPLTGRTHQIRLHLQHLGYSICNDIRYGGCDASSGQMNDLATLVDAPEPATDDDDGKLAPHRFDANAYWSDAAARKAQLEKETEDERLRRIEQERIDTSGSCPICNQAIKAKNGEATSSESASAPVSDLVDADALGSPFSSTRVRVEYIWLHAYRYAYDPSFKHATAGQPASAASSSVDAESTAPPSTPSPAQWSYEIPWPAWALEIAPEKLRRQHERVQVEKDTVEDAPV